MGRTSTALAILALILLSVLPISRALVSAFVVNDAPGAPWEPTTRHIEEAFLPPDAPVGTTSTAQDAPPVRAWGARYRMLGNSVLIGLVSALIAILLAVPYAVLVGRTDIPLRRVLRWAYLIPLVLPPLLVAVAWNYVPFLEPAPITEAQAKADSGWGGVVAVLRAGLLFALCYFPVVVLFALRALRRVPASLEESARIAGGPAAALRRVTLPLSMPGVLAGALFVFLFALNDFAVVDFLNWVRPTSDRISVYPFESFTAWSKSEGPGAATALGIPLAVVGVGLLVVLQRLVGRVPHRSVNASHRPPEPWRLGRWRIPALVGVLALLSLTVVGPVAALLWKAGDIQAYQSVWAKVAGADSSTHEVEWTLWHAGGAALLAMPLAFVLGHHAARARRGWVLVLAMLPLALPPIFLGAGYLRLVNDPSIQSTLGFNPFLDPDSPRWGPTLLLVAKYAPFAIVAAWAAFLEIDPRLEDAARSAGARGFDVSLGVLEPLVRPAMAIGLVLVFVLSLREIDTIVLLSGETVLRKIYTMIHYQRDEQVAALCILLIVMQGLAFAALAILAPWRSAEGRSATTRP